MIRYGLIGRKLGHSFSKNYFAQKFTKEHRLDCQYELFEIQTIDAFHQLLMDYPELEGLNVTVPYKQQIIPLLDEMDAEAVEIGAVNTIHILREEGRTITRGYNTDVVGFRQSLQDIAMFKQALVLGTGGASAAVTYVLRQWNIPYLVASRNPKSDMIGYEQISPEMLSSCDMIVNCTPLGMFPNEDNCPPIPYSALTSKHFLYDLVYNPEETLFLKEGKKRGARTRNGYKMLALQAEASWRIWNGSKRKEYL